VKALIVGYCVAGAFSLLPLLLMPFEARRYATFDEKQARQVRRMAEIGRGEYFLTAWALLTGIGSVVLIVRGHDIGWGWLGVATLWALGVVVGRLHDRRILRLLGDRGRYEHTSELRAREKRLRYFGLAAFVGLVGTGLLRYSYPDDDMPSPAATAFVLLTLVLAAGVLGYLVTTIKMSASLDGPDHGAEP
jgi:hypothetical protein